VAHVCVFSSNDTYPLSCASPPLLWRRFQKSDDVEEHFELQKFMNIIVEGADALLSNNLANFEKLVMSNTIHGSSCFELKNGKLQIAVQMFFIQKEISPSKKNPP